MLVKYLILGPLLLFLNGVAIKKILDHFSGKEIPNYEYIIFINSMILINSFDYVMFIDTSFSLTMVAGLCFIFAIAYYKRHVNMNVFNTKKFMNQDVNKKHISRKEKNLLIFVYFVTLIIVLIGAAKDIVPIIKP